MSFKNDMETSGDSAHLNECSLHCLASEVQSPAKKRWIISLCWICFQPLLSSYGTLVGAQPTYTMELPFNCYSYDSHFDFSFLIQSQFKLGLSFQAIIPRITPPFLTQKALENTQSLRALSVLLEDPGSNSQHHMVVYDLFNSKHKSNIKRKPH